jgi:hypothetical protein
VSIKKSLAQSGQQTKLFGSPIPKFAYTEYEIVWSGISIKVRYCEKSFADDLHWKFYGHGHCHLEIYSPVPLKMTETGFLSHFDRPDNVGEPAAFVLAMLGDHNS